jgi:hypothetical protein
MSTRYDTYELTRSPRGAGKSGYPKGAREGKHGCTVWHANFSLGSGPRQVPHEAFKREGSLVFSSCTNSKRHSPMAIIWIQCTHIICLRRQFVSLLSFASRGVVHDKHASLVNRICLLFFESRCADYGSHFFQQRSRPSFGQSYYHPT